MSAIVRGGKDGGLGREAEVVEAAEARVDADEVKKDRRGRE